jgi:hypothetical protein
VFGQKNICRLDVAVNDLFPVSGIQRVDHAQRDLEQSRHRNGAARERLLKRLALEEFHRDERGIGTDVVDGADVWMIQR